MTEKKDLLLFQIGPVQEFITAARTLDDLWSGSYMIAFLTSSGIKRLCELVGDDAVVFPCLKGQTVYERVWRDGPLGQPTIPNRFCAEVAHERVKCVAGEIKNAILGKFADMSEACFRKFLELFPRSGMSYRKRWDSQVRSFLQISWQSVPLDPGDWGGSYGKLLANLAARRHTRDFAQYAGDSSGNGTIKDALNGRDEIVGDRDEWDSVLKTAPFTADDKPYGAVSIIKRLWRAEFLGAPDNGFPSLKALAAKSEKEAVRYVAAIQMDGDHMGKILGGTARNAEFFTGFSRKLANFTRDAAEKIVKDHEGVLIYAGGDDILVLLPAYQAINCAHALRNKFCEESGDMPGSEKSPAPDVPRVTMSAGIAFCHYKAPIARLLEEARNAEHRAKEHYGRDALAITIVKRSGEIAQWGAKFDSSAWNVYREFYRLRSESSGRQAAISSGFASRLAGMLFDYVPKLADVDAPMSELLPRIILTDFRQICKHQEHGTKIPEEFFVEAEKYLHELFAGDRNAPWDFPLLFLCANFLMRRSDSRDAGGEDDDE